ncbi:MAG: site-2 protease family protein [Rhodobacteraceae bacterium]|jgi:Zn-dependent protease/CBS domain-containing protein|nr:site-2 protease family protein [Paracoccaceae bacterium]
MTWSFPLGRLFGSELRVHATFFLLLLWIGAVAWLAGGPAAAAENVAFILVLFACVVAHEYGHALMARRYGIATPDITLLPIGGLARLERMPERPGQEIAVALAGPAVNVAIWAVLVLVLGVDTDVARLAAIEDAGAGFWGRVAAVNLFLVAFNMIPAFPMDGGRVFRALLAMRLGRVRATRIAATAGQVLAFLFGFLGLTGGSPILVLIAIFVFIAAQAEASDVAMRDAARNVGVRAAMITRFETLPESASLADAADALIRTTQHEFPVLAEDGRLVGFLTRHALFGALAEGRRTGPIAPAIARDVPVVAISVRLDEALEAMHRAAAPAVAVAAPGGRVVGYVTAENVGEFMILSGR